MKRLFILLTLPIWLPVLLLMRALHLGDQLTKEDRAKLKIAAKVFHQLYDRRLGD